MDQLSVASDVVNLQKAMSIVCMAVGLVFGYAAASKFADLRAFVAGVRAYRVVPSRFAPFVAAALIVTECSIALAHLTDAAIEIVAPATAAVLLSFFATTVNTLRHGASRPCLCFGANRDDLVDSNTLLRIALLLTVELSLCAYLAFMDGSILVRITGLYGIIQMLGIGALLIALTGWALAIPRVLRAWHVVKS
jgi:Methylamine utilisation protein MauE